MAETFLRRLFVAIHGMAREPRRRAESRHGSLRAQLPLSLLSCPICAIPAAAMEDQVCGALCVFGARLQMYRMSCVPKDMISPVLLSSISDA